MKTNQSFSILIWINKSKTFKDKAPIYVRITIDGKRAELSTQRSIEPDKWDASAGLVSGKSQEAKVINDYLSMLRSELFKKYNQMIATESHVTADRLKNSFLGIEEEPRSLLQVFKFHNDEMEKLVGIDIVRATYIKFKTVYKKLEDFMKARYKKSDMFLTELNYKFVADFEIYLKTVEKIDHNTAMKYIRNLKKVANMAVKNQWMQVNPFNSFQCTYRKVERDILTAEELSILIACYTGYAFVDVEKLSDQNLVLGIDGEKWIHTSRQKTGNRSYVPLLPQALRIIEKYRTHPECLNKGVLLPVKSNQKMNAYLKEVADLCGINKELTMHIARHTFATTVTLANGVPIETVSSMLGHSSIKTTQIYAKVIEKKVSEDMKVLREKITISDEYQKSNNLIIARL
jgi:integrase